MSDSKAVTGTPDTTNGANIAVVAVTNGASQIVDQQVVTIGDGTDGTLHATVSASGLAVQTGLVTVTQNAAWTISGPLAVTLATGAAVIGALTANQSVTIAATANVLLATGAAVIGALSANQSVTIAATANVLLATGAAVIGALTNPQGVSGTVVLGAGTALAGQVSGSDETSTVYNGTTALTPIFKAVSCVSAAAVVVVTGVTSKQIRVLQYVLVAAGVQNVTWQTTGTAISGTIALATNTGIAAPYTPIGLVQTNAGERLELNLSTTNVTVAGHLVYVTV